VERLREIAVALLDGAQIEIEAGLDAERLEGVVHGAILGCEGCERLRWTKPSSLSETEVESVARVSRR
jgi:hypothetical protein